MKAGTTPVPIDITPYDRDLLIVSLTCSVLSDAYKADGNATQAANLELVGRALWLLRLDGCPKPTLAEMDALAPPDDETLREHIRRQWSNWERAIGVVERVSRMIGDRDARSGWGLAVATMRLVLEGVGMVAVA